uniref:Uncharacterized protein n=1 Tax=viral metagenome TaxID=1070528 RepID=A0A6M3LHH2_9ZZZZ
MIGRELVLNLRETHLDDVKVPYLWETDSLLRLLNYAEVQACRRAHLLIDGTTANDYGTAGTAGTLGQKPLCTVTLVAGTATYNLSPKILSIKRCQLGSMTTPLSGPVSYDDLDYQLLPGWTGTAGSIGTAGSGGHPEVFLNKPGNTITFVRAPSASDTAYLVVSRIPLISFTLQTAPEIDEQHHDGLLDWAAHLAFMKNDSDTLNLNLSKTYEDRFTLRFGPLPDAAAERWMKTFSQKQRMRPRAWGS